jgi:hypothetical protein
MEAVLNKIKGSYNFNNVDHLTINKTKAEDYQ